MAIRKPSDKMPPAGTRLLLVDDNRNGLLARKVVLEQQGYTVTACSSPEDALHHFCTECFQVVVTDYRMPSMNGVELIAEFRKSRASVPVVLVSGMVEVLGLTEANTGADAVVAKNANEVSHMVRAVNRLVQKAAPKKPAGSQGARRNRKASGN